MSRKVLLFVLGVSLVINAVFIYWYDFGGEKSRQVLGSDQNASQYPLLSPDILYNHQRDTLINFSPLRTELHKIVDPYEDSFGLYFEYLSTGTSVGINSNVEFYAASLFKVPVVMAYYHGLERKKITEDQIITIKPEAIDNEFGDLWKKGPGTQIKASEAVRLALEESDNTAIKSLLPLIDREDFSAVYEGLDINLDVGSSGVLISARSYSSILKALHYASVIDKDSSQSILQMLTQSPFNDKLVAGVPKDVTVAHKIGNFYKDGSNQGYRDCGIVYEAKRSYILCMFSSNNEEISRERMKLVSQKVYNYVSTVDR